MAMHDDKVCVQSYAAALEELSDVQIMELQRIMKCVGMDILDGIDYCHQLPACKWQGWRQESFAVLAVVASMGATSMA